MAYVVKAYLSKGDKKPSEIRRFPVDETVLTSYEQLNQNISEKFPHLNDGKFVLKWKDVDDDSISFTSDCEVKNALKSMEGNTFKIFIEENDTIAEICRPKTEMMRICQDEEFAPPPQFRRWMRRFMRRWHAKVITKDEESCNRLLGKDLVKMGANNNTIAESSEEYGVSSGEHNIAKHTIEGIAAGYSGKTESGNSMAEKSNPIDKTLKGKQRQTREVEKERNTCIVGSKVEHMKKEMEPDEKKISESEMSRRSERKKKQVRIVITANDDKESADKKVNLKIEKANRKEKPTRNEFQNAEDISSEQESNQNCPISETKRKHRTMKLNKSAMSDEREWTVWDEHADLITPEEKKLTSTINDAKLQTDLTIQATVNKMLEIGFTNEGDWLFYLLLAMDGNIQKTLETIKRNKKMAKRLKHCTLQE